MEIRDAIFQEISKERDAQEAKFKGLTCRSSRMRAAEKLAVLAEEYGEVAHEVNEVIGTLRSADVHKLGGELIQVAAVCVAWIESAGFTRAEALSKCRLDGGLVGYGNLHWFTLLSREHARVSLLIDTRPNNLATQLAEYVHLIVCWLEALDRS